DESILGNEFSRWHRAEEALGIVVNPNLAPGGDVDQWEWICNPMPPAEEGLDFEILRRSLHLSPSQAVVRGDRLGDFGEPDRQRLRRLFPIFIREQNPFIRRIVRRTREQLENQIDPETGEPFLRPIAVELLGESDSEAIQLPGY